MRPLGVVTRSRREVGGAPSRKIPSNRAATAGGIGCVARGKLSAADADAARARITWTPELEAAAACDLVIECVPERLDVKLRVFRDLDRLAPPRAILASNSSGFPIAAMAGATTRPERVIGWHWASPAYVMRFAEIVATEATSPEVVEAVATHEQVNQLMVDCYRWPVGPFAMVKGAVSGWKEAGK